MFVILNPSHAVHDIFHVTVPTVAAVHDICWFHEVPKVQPADNYTREIDDFLGCEGKNNNFFMM